MFTVFCLYMGLASAAPDQPFPRLEERIRDRSYGEVRGEGPVYGRYRRRSGPIHGWTWPDGVVEHYERLEDGRLVEVRRFGPSGKPLSAVVFGAQGTPVSVKIGDNDVDVSGWGVRTVAGVTLMAPGVPETVDGAVTWSAEGWSVTALAFAEAADPFSDAFRDALASHCGCTLLDRTTTWLDGRPAARYQVRLPDAGVPQVGELWAVQSAEQLLLLASVADNRETLVTGRAVAALLDWK